MNPLVLLGIVVGGALIVSMLVQNSINERVASYDAKNSELQSKLNAKGKCVFALIDIPEGQSIPSTAIEERELEVGKIPVDAIASSTLATGRVAKYGISAGQLISQHDVNGIGIATTFEDRLKPGYRAVTFAIDTNSGVAGFVTPQSHVDILSMVGSGATTMAKPILSDVEVIAVGTTTDKPTAPGKSVAASSITVAVNPEDTQKLIKGISASKLYLALRNANDREPVATTDVTRLFPENQRAEVTPMAAAPALAVPPPPPMAGFAGPEFDLHNPLAAAPAPVAPPHEIEIWAGSKKSNVSVPEM